MKVWLWIKYISILSLIVLFPFDQLFTSLFPGFPISPFRIVFVLITLLAYQYRLAQLAELKKIWQIFLLYCILAFTSIIWSSNQEATILYSLQLLISVMFTLVASIELSRNKFFYENLTYFACIIGAIVASMSLMGVFSERELSNEYRITFAGIGLNAVAISIGYTFVLGITAVFSKRHSNLKKIILITCSLIIFLFLMRTGTRSSIFGVLIALVVAYFFTFKVAIINVLRFIVGVIISYFVFNEIIFTYVGERLRERIMGVGDDFESNSRGGLWEIAFNYFADNLLGTGAGNEIVAYTNHISKEAHNIFVSSLLQLGFIGFLLIFIASVYLFKPIRNIKDKSYKFTAMSLYVFLFLQMMKGSFLQNRLFWIPIVILFAIILFDKRKF